MEYDEKLHGYNATRSLEISKKHEGKCNTGAGLAIVAMRELPRGFFLRMRGFFLRIGGILKIFSENLRLF
jgi:hypothetical protein